jgi:hypothetical protein
VKYYYHNATLQSISTHRNSGSGSIPDADSVLYVSFFSTFFLETSPYLFYKILKCLLVWTLLIWCAIIFTLFSHGYFMSRGLTSREVSMMQRYDNLSYLRNQRNAFSRRTIVENILERLFPITIPTTTTAAAAAADNYSNGNGNNNGSGSSTSTRGECYSWDEIVQMKRSTQAEYTLARVGTRLCSNIYKWFKKNIGSNQQQEHHQSLLSYLCIFMKHSCSSLSLRIICLRYIQGCLRRLLRRKEKSLNL